MTLKIKLDGKSHENQIELDFSMKFDKRGYIEILCNGVIIACIYKDTGRLCLMNLNNADEDEKKLLENLPTNKDLHGATVWGVSNYKK